MLLVHVCMFTSSRKLSAMRKLIKPLPVDSDALVAAISGTVRPFRSCLARVADNIVVSENDNYVYVDSRCGIKYQNQMTACLFLMDLQDKKL